METETSVARLFCIQCLGIFRTTFERCPRDGGRLEPLVGDPIRGSTFADRYVIAECIGEGGMGRVYKARHLHMSRQFAIKILFGDLAAEESMRARFASEAEAASRLSHPNVVSVVDFGGTNAGLMYLAMDFVDGINLGELIDREAPFSPGRAVGLVRRMCRGLQHAHDKGLVHRDFKPDNVIIVEENRTEVPRIVDFGLATLPEMRQVNSRLTADGQVVGSPPYMAPEHLQDIELDHRCDLFSLGVVFYEMLAGMTPFAGTPFEIAQQNVSSTPPPFAERLPGLTVDPAIEAIVMKLLAKKPEHRFGSADEVVEAIDLVVPETRAKSRPTTAPDLFVVPATPAVDAPPRQLTDLIDPVQRKRSVVPVMVLVLALLAAAGVVGYALMFHETAEPSRAGAPRPAPVATQHEAPAAVEPAPPVESPPAPPVEPTPEDAIAVEALASRHGAVLAAVDELERSHGPAVARPFRDRVGALQYDDALANPELRERVMAELEELQTNIVVEREQQTTAARAKTDRESKRKRKRRKRRAKKISPEKGGVIDAFSED